MAINTYHRNLSKVCIPPHPTFPSESVEVFRYYGTSSKFHNNPDLNSREGGERRPPTPIGLPKSSSSKQTKLQLIYFENSNLPGIIDGSKILCFSSFKPCFLKYFPRISVVLKIIPKDILNDILDL